MINVAFANRPYRVGTTAGNFLEIGFGSRGFGMGDAVVSSSYDLSSMYWNPAGLAFMSKSEFQTMYQPWISDISTSFAGIGIVSPQLGSFGIGFFQTNYGTIDVTNMVMQEGTGEQYSANDYCVNLTYARKLAQWFSFGSSFKYISSKIWHTSASAFALDLGVVVNTFFFSPTGNREDGLAIGMSISNYGTKLKYDGIDLLQPIDILPDESGNYQNVEGKFNTLAWELPLIFRIGFAFFPIVTANQRLTVEIDALHPNNNSESVNIGAEYSYRIPAFGKIYLRTGYKALFLEDSQYGVTFGAGFKKNIFNNMALRVDYSYRDYGVFGGLQAYTFSVTF